MITLIRAGIDPSAYIKGYVAIVALAALVKCP